MENLRSGAQPLGEGRGSDRQYHKLLDIHVIVGVLTAINDIHHWHGHAEISRAVNVCNMLIQRHLTRLGRRLGRGQGDCQNGIGTELGFVISTIGINHGRIQVALGGGVRPHQEVLDGAIDMAHCVQHALTHVTGAVTVAQFQRLTRSGGSAGGGAGRTDLTRTQGDFRHDGGIAARIHDLEGLYVGDITHCYSSVVSVVLFDSQRGQ